MSTEGLNVQASRKEQHEMQKVNGTLCNGLSEHAHSTGWCPSIRQDRRPQPSLSLRIGWICRLLCNIKGTFKRWHLHGFLSYVTDLKVSLLQGNADLSLRQVAAWFCARFW